MLSILIPTKDYSCRKLVEDLCRQANECGIGYEIIVGEDGSSPDNMTLNAPVAQLPHCRIIVRQPNVGRSRIRNILAREARGNNLLFIDSDAAAEQNDILLLYTQALKEHRVVCGGLYHSKKPQDGNCSLRHRYELAADRQRGAREREKAPYDRFSTFCFAIRRELFLSISFDESIRNYGYEDTLFGYELRRRGVEIKHIDAPLLHIGLESNSVYLAKVEESLRTLQQLKDKIEPTTLLRCYARIESMHLTGAVALAWGMLRPVIRTNLLGRHPSLTLFNIYKIGYYCSLNSR
ncbi:MAG: glycosyltransferase [Bacteroidaceae bacterium]|nr:glycosyltransferase [Bacteroidaceae bacterium]